MFILEKLAQYAETGRTAIIYNGVQTSYAELNRQSDAFAAWLRETLPDSSAPVLIYGHKDSAIPACMLGSLKAGRG